MLMLTAMFISGFDQIFPGLSSEKTRSQTPVKVTDGKINYHIHHGPDFQACLAPAMEPDF